MDRKNSKQFFKIFVIYFVILIAFVGVRIASNFGLFDFIENEILLDLFSTGIIQIGILFLMPFVLYLSFFKKKPKQVIAMPSLLLYKSFFIRLTSFHSLGFSLPNHFQISITGLLQMLYPNLFFPTHDR